MIRAHKSQSLSRGLSERIMKMADTDKNGYLDFEEFYKLAQTNRFFMNIATNYCRFIVPRRDGKQATDEIGKKFEIIRYSSSFLLIYKIYVNSNQF